MKRVSILLIAVALIAGMVGCGQPGHTLTIASVDGGSVTTPGEGTFTFDEQTVVNLVAESEEGYYFVNWIGDVDTIADVNVTETDITMNGDYSITANFEQIPQAPPGEFNLTVSSTTGGNVTIPGEGNFTYSEGMVLELVAEANEAYLFYMWFGDVGTIADTRAAITAITVNGDYAIKAVFLNPNLRAGRGCGYSCGG